MYESFYGLSELPFELTANPKYLYLSARQREALSILQYGLFSAKSLTLLIGEAGTGKTTLIQAALESERCRDVRGVYLNNPTLRPDDFIRLLARKLELERRSRRVQGGAARAAGSAPARTARGWQSRRRSSSTRRRASVIEMLEEIRLLANIETPEAKLLPLVLAGQTGAGGAARRAGPAAVEAAGHAARSPGAVRARGHGGLYCQPNRHRRRRARPHVQSRCGHAHPRIVRRHAANDQRHLRQRAPGFAWRSGASASTGPASPRCRVTSS